MLKESASAYPLVELKGRPYDLGQQHGTLLKEKVHLSVKKFFELILQYDPAKTKSQILKASRRFADETEKWNVDVTEEIRGISDGAGMEFEEVFAVNCLTELSMNVKDFGPTFFGCTAFCAQGSATEENKIFIGQNQDLWAPWCRDLFTVLKINPSSGPRILTTTLAGMVGMVGMNSEGLAIVGNGLSATGNQLGVPIMLFTRQTLSKRTIGEVIDLYTKSKRASPLNVMVGNSDGEIYDFELAPKDLDYFYTGDGVFAHTNNFLSEKMKGQETVKESIFYPDTIVRVNRMSKLLHDKEGHIKLEDVQGFLSDHVNRPRSICRHPDPTIPQDRWEDQWETTASVVMELKGSKMWIAPGNPCMNEYHEYN